jgi:hypothetical protein
MTFVPPPLAKELPPRSEFTIDLITRTAATALLFIYGIGFVILGFHDAKYGVIQFSPFRARIFLVGFVFASFVSLAAAAYHYSFAYFGPLELIVKDIDPLRRGYRETVLISGFVFTATLIASYLGGFIFYNSPEMTKMYEPLWQGIASVAIYGIGLLLFFVAAKIYMKRPGLATVLSLFAAITVLASRFFQPHQKPSFYLTLLLFVVGFHTALIKQERNHMRYMLDFRNWFFVFILLWLYINGVFNAVPQRWGGGQPTPVQIFQNNPASWSPSNPMDVLMLDESDQGFYVLLSPNGKAFFVPRSNVSSILFGSKSDLPKKP